MQPTAGSLPPANQLNACEGTRILARIGPEVILEGDIAGAVNGRIAANKTLIPPEQLDAARDYLTKMELKNAIENKLVYLDAKEKIPPEGWAQVEKQLEKVFEEEDSTKS